MKNKLHLNAIVTRALLDSEFEESILNGKRRECLEMFKLNQAEKDIILAIEADGLDQFIRQLDELTISGQRFVSEIGIMTDQKLSNCIEIA